MKRIYVVYPFMHHYRAGVFDELDRSQRFEFVHVSDVQGVEGIPALPADAVENHVAVSTRTLGPVRWQRGLLRALIAGDYDAVVFLGDASIASTWLGAVVARARGRRVAFWTIGWHRPEAGLKRVIRLAFYRLANQLFLYGKVGFELGIQMGYPRRRMTVIGNSISTSPKSERECLSLPDKGDEVELVGAVIRLIPVKRLDLLVQSVAILRARGRSLEVLLVGEGPERERLSSEAERLHVPLHLPGAGFGAATLARVYDLLDVTVVPAAVGLTAVQSMAHGVTVVSDDDVYSQMPEWESIVEGETGRTYRAGDVESLADAIERQLIQVAEHREELSGHCKREYDTRWSPASHARNIADAIDAMLTSR